ncbi:hypothetical protein ACFY2W_15210 [Streptomyces sp. NPDC001262]|uniref:hypothetical protein n=1 Tax=unclassified Streptomyces TaxID=2593676 RepID=UPI0036CAC83F
MATREEHPWYAEYRFFRTTGSYQWHVHLSNAWKDMREFAASDLRDSLDTVLGGLIPDAPAPWGPELLLLRTPDEVPALARSWHRAAPRLGELREPFETESAGWAGRPDTFDDAVALLHEWGEIVMEADRRGWGLVGLP